MDAGRVLGFGGGGSEHLGALRAGVLRVYAGLSVVAAHVVLDAGTLDPLHQVQLRVHKVLQVKQLCFSD